MIYTNISSKEDVQNYVNYWKISVEKIDKTHWKIKDKCLNEWILFFESVNEWRISTEDFYIYFYFEKDEFNIYKVITKNRTYTSDKYMKKYAPLCCQITSLIKYKYIKF